MLLIVGCGGKNKQSANDPKRMAGGDGMVPAVDPTLCETSGKRVETFDLNRDQRPDVWKLYATIEEGGARLEILTCKQVDFDHDGSKDYVVAYNKKGARVFEKYDYDFDGVFDSFAQFDEKSGAIVEVQSDSDFDGKYDILEIYGTDGQLKSLRRDRNADEKPDLWEQYERGQLVAILYDEDYDGKVDRREESPGNTAPNEMPQPQPVDGQDLDTGADTSADTAEPQEGADSADAPATTEPATNTP